MAAPNFVLITELQTLTRRDMVIANPLLLQPFNANPLIDGEWLAIDSNYAMARGTGEGVDTNVFPWYGERGRYDTQAIGKITMLMLGMYEAETTVCDIAGIALGAALTVQDCTIGALTKRGLKVEGATSNRVRVGYVSKVLAGQSKIRFIHYGNAKV